MDAAIKHATETSAASQARNQDEITSTNNLKRFSGGLKLGASSKLSLLIAAATAIAALRVLSFYSVTDTFQSISPQALWVLAAVELTIAASWFVLFWSQIRKGFSDLLRGELTPELSIILIPALAVIAQASALPVLTASRANDINLLSLYLSPAILCGLMTLMWQRYLKSEGAQDDSHALLNAEPKESLSGIEEIWQPGAKLPYAVVITRGLCAVDLPKIMPGPHFRIMGEGERLPAGALVVSGECCARSDQAQGNIARKPVHDKLLLEDSTSVVTNYGIVGRAVVASLLIMTIFLLGRALSPERTAQIITAASMLGSLACLVTYLIVMRMPESVASALNAVGASIRSIATLRRLGRGVKRLSVIASSSELTGLAVCAESEILDTRVSKKALFELTSLICAWADDANLASIADFCRKEISSIEPPTRISEYKEYPGRGVAASLQGVEISVGTETFLVERGVVLQSSELPVEYTADSVWIYVAAGDSVLARFRVTKRFYEETQETILQFKQQGLDVELYGFNLSSGDELSGRVSAAKPLPNVRNQSEDSLGLNEHSLLILGRGAGGIIAAGNASASIRVLAGDAGSDDSASIFMPSVNLELIRRILSGTSALRRETSVIITANIIAVALTAVMTMTGFSPIWLFAPVCVGLSIFSVGYGLRRA